MDEETLKGWVGEVTLARLHPLNRTEAAAITVSSHEMAIARHVALKALEWVLEQMTHEENCGFPCSCIHGEVKDQIEKLKGGTR